MPARSSQALELVAPHCDIVDRLRFVPPSAAVRGVFFRNVEVQVERMGQSGAYRGYFPEDRYASLPYYPLSDFMLRLACAGALVATPECVHDGMRKITQGNATTFVHSLLGRALVRLAARDPLRLTQQGLAARRQSHRYGRWSLLPISASRLQVLYEDEFLWIDSAVHGAAEGTYVACSTEVQLATELTGRYTGRTTISW